MSPEAQHILDQINLSIAIIQKEIYELQLLRESLKTNC